MNFCIWQKTASLQHVVVVFHPGWRTPGRNKEFKVLSEMAMASLIIGTLYLRSWAMLKLRDWNPFHYIGIIVWRKSQLFDIGPTKWIAYAFVLIKVKLKKQFSFVWWKFIKCLCTGIGKGASNANEFLKGRRFINKTEGSVSKVVLPCPDIYGFDFCHPLSCILRSQRHAPVWFCFMGKTIKDKPIKTIKEKKSFNHDLNN